MKIGVDIRSLEAEPSGVSEYSEYLIKHILAQDNHNQYFLFYNAFRQPISRLKEKFHYKNCELVFFNTPNKIFNFRQIFLRSPKLDYILNGVDLFFLPNINFVSFTSQAKFVVTVHDLSFKYFPSFFSAKRRLWHFFIQPRRLFKQAEHLIAVSKNTKEDLIRLYHIPANKITVINSGINVEKKELTKETEEAIRNKYQLGKNFILSLSNLEPRKNIESLILAYNQLRQKGYNFDLVIVGKPSWSYRQIFKLAKSSPYKQNIHLLGYIDSIDKNYLYQMCDLFVYPSFYEGFGFPPLEAMYFGQPVITSFHSSLPEVVKDAALLIDPYNVSEIVQAMQICLTDKRVRQEMRQNGQKVVFNYSWSKAASDTINLFNSLIKKHENRY